MTPDQVNEAIQERFKLAWGTTTIFTLENEKFTQPGADVSWVRLSVRHFGGGQFTLGPKGQRKYNRIGMIIGQVFTPLIKGTQSGASLAHAFRAIFEGERFSDVYAWDGRLVPVGPDGKHFQTNVEIDITFEETK